MRGGKNGKERGLVRIVSFSEVVRCPGFRLDPEHYIPRHRRWECGRAVRHGSRGRRKGVSEGGWVMDEEGVRRILVECLGKEGGKATLDRLLYAYQALRGLDRGELLKIAEGCEEIEVVKKRYRPWDDRETVIILRLRSFEGKSHSNERGCGC